MSQTLSGNPRGGSVATRKAKGVKRKKNAGCRPLGVGNWFYFLQLRQAAGPSGQFRRDSQSACHAVTTASKDMQKQTLACQKQHPARRVDRAKKITMKQHKIKLKMTLRGAL